MDIDYRYGYADCFIDGILMKECKLCVFNQQYLGNINMSIISNI